MYKYKKYSNARVKYLAVVLVIAAAVLIFLSQSQNIQVPATNQPAVQQEQQPQAAGPALIEITGVSADDATLTVRNAGSAPADVSQIAVYVNDVETSCDFDVTNIAPQSTATCRLRGGCTAGYVVKVVSLTEDEIIC